ncbi:MAG: hypothetical protein JXR96_02440 [Deltaproteobacteria bacterium]|nr:hypothetical protein [Deltaproteobacteria bacterium]
MSERTVTLREIRDEHGLRYLGVRIDENGDLVIEGQDLGSGVESFWGEGASEYEWIRQVKARDLPRLLEALGAKPEADLLSLLGERFSGDRASELERFLKAHAIPSEFWSRVGD